MPIALFLEGSETYEENAMRDFLGPVDAAHVQTELGPIYVLPGGTKGAEVHAPHLTVDGVPLQASAYLTSDGEPSKFNLIQTWDVKKPAILH
jgi:hypothetical protein